MNNSMKFFKRLTAFLLAMLLVTTMMGDDFSSLADETEISTSSEDSGGGSSDSSPAAEESAPAAEPASAPESAAQPAAETASEPVAEPAAEPGAEAADGYQEPDNSQDVGETTPEEQVGESDAENSTDENIVNENGDPIETIGEAEEPTEEKPEEELTEEEKAELERLEQERLEKELLEKEELEEEECEHSWVYISNGDGTHTIKCEKCGEVDRTEPCTFEDHICIHCGYEEEVVEEECEHEWEYTSNDDGTHTKRCVKCGEEEIEDCDFDEDWVCKLCGYEDMSLTYQSYSKTLHGVKVTVSGEMPRKSEVTIYFRYLRGIENIVNNNLDEGVFTAFAAYDISIYDRHGNKYQPEDDNNTVKVTFEGVDEVDEIDEKTEDIVVYRIEDDNSITEINASTSGESVSFEAEHFTVYTTGTYSNVDYAEFKKYENFATLMTVSSYEYTRVLNATFDLYIESEDVGETYEFDAAVYKNVSSNDLAPEDSKIATGSYSY
ncbi:MAG: hypothetical protein IJ675_07125, partial [Pseudobutyrivibrio sp.]|nr:hypothetical protein [Pseudobutyrivibrio sp.]